jgi:hypothetical protein
VKISVLRPIRPAIATILLGVVLVSCSRTAPELRPPPHGSSAPLLLSGQRVLVVPLQTAGALPFEAGPLESEIVFALGERDPRVTWITPDEVRRAARRSPLFASDPDALPTDAMLHRGERRVVEPLAGELRRFSALVDARLVLLPRLSLHIGTGDGEQAVRLSAVVVDARSNDILWWAEMPAPLEEMRARPRLASLAEELAQRLVSVGSPGAQR